MRVINVAQRFTIFFDEDREKNKFIDTFGELIATDYSDNYVDVQFLEKVLSKKYGEKIYLHDITNSEFMSYRSCKYPQINKYHSYSIGQALFYYNNYDKIKELGIMGEWCYGAHHDKGAIMVRNPWIKGESEDKSIFGSKVLDIMKENGIIEYYREGEIW